LSEPLSSLNISKATSGREETVNQAVPSKERQIHKDEEMFDKDAFTQNKGDHSGMRKRTFSSASLEATWEKMEWGHFDPRVEWPPEPVISKTSSKGTQGLAQRSPKGQPGKNITKSMIPRF
jgi:hypothetical protein